MVCNPIFSQHIYRTEGRVTGASSTTHIRIALGRGRLPFADTLRCFFDLGETVHCVAVFPTAEDALLKVPALAPEVLLVDINLPEMSGVELVARMKVACPSVLCVILTDGCIPNPHLPNDPDTWRWPGRGYRRETYRKYA